MGLSARPDGSIPTGIITGHADNLSYASWAQETKFASPLTSILYTTEPHPTAYFNAFFAAVGLVARWSGEPVIGLLNVAGLAGAGIAVFAVYHIALRMGLTGSAARWSVLFLVASSGCSSVVRVVCQLLHISPDPFSGTDSYYFDAFGFSTFLVYPYHAFSLAWMTLVLWLALIVEDHVSSQSKSWRLLLLGALALAMFFVHPYEGTMAAATYPAYAVMAALRTDGSCARRRGTIALTLVVPALLGSGYGYWLAQSSPVWDHFARSSLSLPVSRLDWLVGYGLILPLALVGAVRTFFDGHLARARWMASWTLLLCLLLIAVNVQFTKICNGGQVPLSLMAGAAWAYLLDRVAMWKSDFRRSLGYVAAVVLGSVLVSENVALLREWSRRSEPHLIEADLVRAAANIRTLSHNPLPTVLCDVSSGSLLPGVAGFRVYAGHRTLTLGFADKSRKLAAAGFDPAQHTPTPFDPTRVGAAFDTILETSQADFVLLSTEAPALTFALAHTSLRPAGSFGRWKVFSVLR